MEQWGVYDVNFQLSGNSSQIHIIGVVDRGAVDASTGDAGHSLSAQDHSAR